MSGINFNDLPKNLQQVLSPYIGIAKSVDDAIAIAKENGKWSAENDKQYTALNGGKAWGQVTDSFDPSKAAEYRREAAVAEFKNSLAYVEQPKQSDGQFVLNFDGLKNSLKTIGKIIVSLPFIFQSCTPEPIILPEVKDEKTITITITNKLNETNDKSNFEVTMEAMLEALNTIARLEAKIANNTDMANEELEDLKKLINDLKDALATANSHLAAIINNQEKNADTAKQYYNLILGAIGDNSELLQTVIEKLTENNSTLSELQKLMKENNQDNKKILEVVTQIKYGIDKLGEDNEEIKTLLKAIRSDIQNNGKKLDSLLALLNVVNQIIEKGNAQQKEATDKILAELESINYNMSWGMVEILNAIKNGDTKILNKVDDILAMLKTMDKNNEERNKKVLTAIAKLNGDMTNGFKTLIALGEKANGTLDQILKLMNNLPCGDMSAVMSKLDGVIVAINANGLMLQGSLDNLYSLLEAINAKLEKLDENTKQGFAAVVKAIEDKIINSGCNCDFNKIISKLDTIIEKIKDHTIKIVIDKNGNATVDEADEGSKEHLDWLLG